MKWPMVARFSVPMTTPSLNVIATVVVPVLSGSDLCCSRVAVMCIRAPIGVADHCGDYKHSPLRGASVTQGATGAGVRGLLHGSMVAARSVFIARRAVLSRATCQSRDAHVGEHSWS